MVGKLIKISFIILALSFTFSVFGYDNLNTHPAFTEAAISSFNANSSQKITQKESDWIIKGSIDEDTDPRYLNHFYDPTTGQGLNNWDSFNGASVFAKGLPAKEWAQNQASLTGDYSEAAILKNYQSGDLARAYQGVGHILHLIQDMAVPAHTRNDPHAGGDPYEKWAEQYNLINKNATTFINVNNLGQTFDQLANYSNNNFFSKDTINIKNQLNYNKLYEQVGGKTRMYLLSQLDNLFYKLVYSENPDSVNSVFKVDGDLKLNQDYWNMLYPKAVGYSAGVIDYFIKKFNQIDQSKKSEEQLSLADKFKKLLSDFGDKIKYAWGDVFMINRIALTNGYDKTLTLLDISKGNLQNFSDANKEIITQVAEQTADTAKKAAGKVLSATETSQTKTPAIKQQIKSVKPAKTTENKKSDAKLPAPQVKGEKIYADLNEPPAGNIAAPAAAPKSGPILIAGDGLAPETEITSAPDGITNLKSAAFVFTSNEGNSTFECGLDNGEWFICGSPYELSNLSDGEHVFKVRARDSSNNTDQTPAEHSWTVDTAASPVIITDGPPDVSSSTAANFQFDADENYVNYQYSLDSGSWQSCSASTTVANLTEGRHNLEVRGADLGGNISSSTAKTWLVDLTAPVSAVSALDASYPASGFSVSWSGSDADAAGATSTASGVDIYDVQYKIGAGDWQNWLMATSATSSIFNLAVDNGQTVYFRSRARDLAGNVENWPVGADISTTILPKHLVISQIQLAGGTVTDEFVELYNATDDTINLNGYRLSRKTASGNEYNLLTSFPNISLPSHNYYLIAHPTGYDGGGTPDSYYSTSQSIAGDNTIILYSDAGATVVDKVGMGAAGDFETSAYQDNPSDNQSLLRKASAASTEESMSAGGAEESAGNGYDSGDNGRDFILVTVVKPRSQIKNIITVGNVSNNYLSGLPVFSWQHNVSGSDPLLLVTFHADGLFVTSVAYDGLPMNLLSSKNYSAPFNNFATYVYYLSNPPLGTHNITVNTTGSWSFVMSAITLNNVDTVNPIKYVQAILYGGSNMTRNIEADEGDMMVDGVTYNKPDRSIVPVTAGTGQTQYYEKQTDGIEWQGQVNPLYAGDSYKLANPGNTQTMGWITEDRPNAYIIMLIKHKP